MTVYEKPAWSSGNPYNALLCDSLVAHGLEVVEWTRRAGLRARRGDVVHLHWPGRELRHGSWGRATASAAVLLLQLALARSRGAAVVYTAHNVENHDSPRPRTERAFWWAFTRLVTAWISLSPAAAVEVVARHPALGRRRSATVAHGHYRDRYPAACDPAAARAAMGLPVEGRVIGFVGRVEPYKQVGRLVEAFSRWAGPTDHLLVAGEAPPELADRLVAAAGHDRRVHLRLERIPDEEVPLVVGASDVVVVPYAGILNSGTALLALSLDRPFVAPAAPALVELGAEVGPGWVRTYRPPLDDAVLDAAVAPAPAGRPDLGARSWAILGGRTAELLRRWAAP